MIFTKRNNHIFKSTKRILIWFKLNERTHFSSSNGLRNEGAIRYFSIVKNKLLIIYIRVKFKNYMNYKTLCQLDDLKF